MTRLTAEARRQRLLRQFHRSGQEGQWLRVFDHQPEELRTRLLHMAAVRGDELPVLSYFRDEAHWVLLTTEQLITQRPEGVLHMPWGEIENATVDSAHVKKALTSEPGGKMALSRLKVLLRGGVAVELELEAGAAFFGFWNVLKTVAAMGGA